MTNTIQTNVSVNDTDITIVIIEDDAVIRESYEFLINSTIGYKVINTHSSYEEAAKSLLPDNPDVILLDLELPGKNGIDAIPDLKQLLPEVYILVLTVYENEDAVFNALRNGASGYLTKNTSSSKIIEAIREVVHGGGPMSAPIAGLVIKSLHKNIDSPLTRREAQILEMFADGKSRTVIASELFVDPETIKTHVKNIYFKLNVHSKADAIRAARINKLI